MISKKLLIVNFGGPRTLQEVESFLIALLTDRDLIVSRLPDFMHRWFFTRIAKKRTKNSVHDYQLIGGGSPIYADTEFIAQAVAQKLELEYLTFHRYLVDTHAAFIQEMTQERGKHFVVFPLFPQFSYTTTGSIARWFANQLPQEVVDRFEWVKSYPTHSAYIEQMVLLIEQFMQAKHLRVEESVLLFSAHGLPKSYVDRGDSYQQECIASFEKIASYFPEALNQLSYQSRFGKAEWLRPYTDEFCQKLLQPRKEDKQVIFVPLSFTSDHVETLYEIEYQYLPLIRNRGLKAYRLPALNRTPGWIEAIAQIIDTAPKVANATLFQDPFCIG